MNSNINGRYNQSNIFYSKLKKVEKKNEEEKNQDLKEVKDGSKKEAALDTPQYGVGMLDALARQNRMRIRSVAHENPTKTETKIYEPSDVAFIAECIDRKNANYKVDESSIQKNEDGSYKPNEDGSYTLVLVNDKGDRFEATLKGKDALEFFKIGLDVFYKQEREADELIDDYLNKLNDALKEKFNTKAEELKTQYISGKISQKEFKAGLQIAYYSVQLDETKLEEFEQAVGELKDKYVNGDIKLKEFKAELQKIFNNLTQNAQGMTSADYKALFWDYDNYTDDIKAKIDDCAKEAEKNNWTKTEFMEALAKSEVIKKNNTGSGSSAGLKYDTVSYRDPNNKLIMTTKTYTDNSGKVVMLEESTYDKDGDMIGYTCTSKNAEGEEKTVEYHTQAGDGQTGVVTAYRRYDGSVNYIRDTIKDTNGNEVKEIYTYYDKDGNVKCTATYDKNKSNEATVTFTYGDKTVTYTTQAGVGQTGVVTAYHRNDGSVDFIFDTIKDADGNIVKEIFTYYDKDGNVKCTATYDKNKSNEATVTFTYGDKTVTYTTQAGVGQTGVVTAYRRNDGSVDFIFDTIKDADGNEVKEINTFYDENGKVTRVNYKENSKTSIIEGDLAQFVYQHGDSGSIDNEALESLKTILQAQNIEFSEGSGKIEFTVAYKTFTYSIE